MKTKDFILNISIVFGGFVCLVEASFGGHDLFTSLAQLEVVWHGERQVVEDMVQIINKLDTMRHSLQNYVSRYNELRLNETPNYDFLGHPINAFHFIRHVASGWDDVRKNVLSDDFHGIANDLEKLKNREQEKLPNEDDVAGAAHGLVRLYSLYQFDVQEFSEKGRISTTLDNGQLVLSEPSLLPVNSFDLTYMSQEAAQHGLHDAATVFLEAATKKAVEEKKDNVDLSNLFGFNLSVKRLEAMTATAKRVHDEVLVKRGMKSHLHRTFQYPFDEKLRKKKKFSKKMKIDIMLGRNQWEALENLQNSDVDENAKYNLKQENQRDLLCRGKQLRSKEELAKLKCLYSHNGSPWLRLGPMKMEINAYDPFNVVYKDMLYEHECNSITKFLGPKLDFPPGRMNSKSQANDWTMKNCWPNENDNIVLEKLNRRIEHATGLWAATVKNFSEPFMCGNYGIGGHYWTHPDFHHPTPEHWMNPLSLGNRVATILTLLEAPKAGGATVWPYAGISVFPEKGSAVFWHNLRSSNIPDNFTKHAACPVLLGQKWIGNKWVGYNAQWNKNKCGLRPFDAFEPILK